MTFEGPQKRDVHESSDVEDLPEPNISSAKNLLDAIEAQVREHNVSGLIDNLDTVKDKLEALKGAFPNKDKRPTKVQDVITELEEREAEITGIIEIGPSEQE